MKLHRDSTNHRIIKNGGVCPRTPPQNVESLGMRLGGGHLRGDGCLLGTVRYLVLHAHINVYPWLLTLLTTDL